MERFRYFGSHTAEQLFAYFAGVLDSSPDCIRVLDPDGRVEFMNARGLELLEIEDFERNRGRLMWELWPEEARRDVEGAIRSARSGRTVTFRAFCPTAKGTPKWWDTSVAPVSVDGANGIVRLLATSRDITQQLTTKSFLDTIVRTLPAALFVKHAESGRIVLANRAAEDLVGAAEGELLGRTPEEAFSPELARLSAEADAEALAEGDAVSQEHSIRAQDGELRRYRLKKTRTGEAAAGQHLMTLAEDVTEITLALEQAESASRAKSAFLATMSHEIRTPLNGILGMAQALEAEPLEAEHRNRLRVIRSSGETLAAILNDVLDLSRIEAGELQLESVTFDLEHVARGAVAVFAAVADRKGLDFRFSIDEPAKGAYRGDPVRMRQVIYNLISNALKFTDAGGVGMAISRLPEGVAIEVADSGRGIASHLIEPLFESFVQGDATATRRAGGAGLGLAICRRLVDLMGGHIDVSSVEGKGSLFRVLLPLERICDAQPLASARPAASLHEEAETKQEIRILAAEDNEVNRLVLRTLLSQAGLDPVVVENGEEAVEAWKSAPWDLILMDIQMPVMDGVAATRAIRSLEAQTGRARTPIIAVTANAMAHQVGEYESAGIDTIVAKPISAPALFEALDQAL